MYKRHGYSPGGRNQTRRALHQEALFLVLKCHFGIFLIQNNEQMNNVIILFFLLLSTRSANLRCKCERLENINNFEHLQNKQFSVPNRGAPYVTHTGTFWTCAHWSASCWWSRAADFASEEWKRLRQLTWKHWKNIGKMGINWNMMKFNDGNEAWRSWKKWSKMKMCPKPLVRAIILKVT